MAVALPPQAVAPPPPPEIHVCIHVLSVVEPEPPGAALFGRSREKRGGSDSSSRSSYDPIFEEQIEQKC